MLLLVMMCLVLTHTQVPLEIDSSCVIDIPNTKTGRVGYKPLLLYCILILLLKIVMNLK